jgi:hypothetical protein
MQVISVGKEAAPIEKGQKVKLGHCYMWNFGTRGF